MQSIGQTNAPRPSLEAFLGGKEAYATISSPDSVTACLLNSPGSERRTLLIVDPSISKAFSAALTDDKSHYRSIINHCLPDYGMQMRFKRGNDTVTVNFCFGCQILQITHDEYVVEEGFRFAKNDFVNLAKKLFPNDKTIQQLKEAHENQD